MNPSSVEDHVLEQIRPVVPITTRRMFGCIGIYSDAAFFAIVDGPCVYFKVDEHNRPGYETRGMGPFTPHATGKQIASFSQVPDDVLGEPDTLRSWAEDAIAAANRKKA